MPTSPNYDCLTGRQRSERVIGTSALFVGLISATLAMLGSMSPASCQKLQSQIVERSSATVLRISPEITSRFPLPCLTRSRRRWCFECVPASETRAPSACGQTRNLFRDNSLVKHCQACHGGSKPEGDVRVMDLSRDFSEKDIRRRWLAVLDQVESGNMPPAKPSATIGSGR